MTDKTMLDILSKFADASDESKPLTEGKKSTSSDAEMANILGKLQQLNESAEPVAEETIEEAEKKCDDCGEPVSKCECEGHDHKEEMDEASCSSKRKSAMKEAVEQIESRLMEEYDAFKKPKPEGPIAEPARPDTRTKYEKYPYVKTPMDRMKEKYPRLGKPGSSKINAVYIEPQPGDPGKEPEGPIAKPAPAPGGKELPPSITGKQPSKDQIQKYFDRVRGGRSDEIYVNAATGERFSRADLDDRREQELRNKIRNQINSLKEQIASLREEPNEGNEFSGALAKAKASGAKTFKVGDKEYNVKEGFEKWEPVGTKKKTKHGTEEKTATGLKHTRDYKPDYLDLDGDGDKEEPMKKAAKDAKKKKKS